MDHTSDHETTAGSAGVVATTVNRRTMNAFLLFCKRHRGIVKERYPTLENRNITKILGDWWQSLSDDDRSTFNALANEYKEHVAREMPQSAATAAGGAKLNNIKEQTAAAVLVTNGGRVSSHLSSASSSPEPTPPPPPPPPPQPPHHRHSAEAAPVAATEEAGKNSVVNVASSNSGSSSSASSIVSLSSSSSSAAPKPFKKRYLANFDTASLAAAAAAATTVSPEAEHACKALLQLAGVRESSPTTLGAPNSTASAAASSFTCPTAVAPPPPPPPPPAAAADTPATDRNCEPAKLEVKSEGSCSRNGSSRSGTASPPESSSATEKERGKLTANGFRTLRDAVWSRVAKTLLKQEEEKGMLNHAGAGNDDAPLNLSSQCTIRGQTIIEHIIENCMQAKPTHTTSAAGGNGDKGGDREDAASRSATGNAILVNMNNNGVSGGGDDQGGGSAPSPQAAETAGGSGADSPFSAEEIKERIYEGLKQDLLSTRSGEKRDSKEAAALWNMLPHIKIAQERAEGKLVTIDPKPVAEPDGSNLTKSDDDDGSKLSIKHLLAQSPAPLSPRSRSGNSSSKSSAAVSPNAAASASASAASAASAVSVTLVSNDRSSDMSGASNGQPVNLSTTPPQTPSATTSVVTISTMSAAAATPRAASMTTTTSKRSLSSAGGGETSAASPQQQQGPPAKRKLLGGGGDAAAAAPTAEEEEDHVRRSSRSCKGRLYQEFKDEGRLGRSKSGATGSLVADRSALVSTRKAHKSGDSFALTLSSSADVAMNRRDQNTHSLNHNSHPPSPFDITAKLNAIPALSLDSYQQKAKAKHGGAVGGGGNATEESSTRNARPTTSHHQQQQQQPQPQARRRSGDNIESTPPKRKSRRTATAAAAAASMGATPAVSPTAKKDAKEEQQLMTTATVNVVVSS